MRWVRRLPTLGDWGRIVDRRQVMLEKLPERRGDPDRRMSVEDVLGYGAQLVIVATGSRWTTTACTARRAQPIGGVSDELPHALTPEQVMDGKRPRAARGRLRRRGLLHRAGDRGAARRRGTRGTPGDLARGRVADLGPHPGGSDAPPTRARGRRVDAPRCDRPRGRAGPRLGRGRVRGPLVVGRRRRRARDAAGVRRRALSRTGGGPGRLGDERDRGRVPDRRLRGATDDLRGDLRRPSAGREIDGPDPSIALPFDRERGLPDVDPVRAG